MRRAILVCICLVLTGLAIWVFVEKNSYHGLDLTKGDPPPDETRWQRQRRLMKEAEADLQKTVTNVTGWRRTMSATVLDADDNPMKWEAHAEVEFFNKMRGVEKTNLYYRSGMSFGHVYWVERTKAHDL